MNFKEATDVLFERITHEDLARVLGASVAAVRQARLGEGAAAHRNPPNGWEKAVRQLAEDRLKQLAALTKHVKVRHP
jgi:hypothetical protein